MPMTEENKTQETALNLYKGNWCKMTLMPTSRIFLSPIPIFNAARLGVWEYIQWLCSRPLISSGRLTRMREMRSFNFITISTYDYYTGLDILITDRWLFLGLKGNRSLSSYFQQKLEKIMGLLNIITIPIEMILFDIIESCI